MDCGLKSVVLENILICAIPDIIAECNHYDVILNNVRFLVDNLESLTCSLCWEDSNLVSTTCSTRLWMTVLQCEFHSDEHIFAELFWKCGDPMASMWTKHLIFLSKGVFRSKNNQIYLFFAKVDLGLSTLTPNKWVFNDVQHVCKYVFDSWRLWLHKSSV